MVRSYAASILQILSLDLLYSESPDLSDDAPKSSVYAADDLLAFLERSKAGLKPGGLMIIKENICEQGFIVDPV